MLEPQPLLLTLTRTEAQDLGHTLQRMLTSDLADGLTVETLTNLQAVLGKVAMAQAPTVQATRYAEILANTGSHDMAETHSTHDHDDAGCVG